MSFFGFILLLIIAAICGGIGQRIGGYKIGSGGCLMSAGVGFIGAIIGRWISRELNLPKLWAIHIDGEPFPVIWAIVGAAIFTGILGSLIKSRKE